MKLMSLIQIRSHVSHPSTTISQLVTWLLVSTVLTTLCVAAPTSLETVLTTISQDNPRLAQLKEQATQYKARRNTSISDFFPTVSLGYDRLHSDQRGSRRLSNLQLNPQSVDELFFDPINSQSIKTSLRQPILDLSILNQLFIQNTQAKLINTRIKQAEHDIFQTAITRFYDILTGMRYAAVLESKVSVLEKITDRYSIELTGNLVTREDYLNTKHRLIETQKELYAQYQRNKLAQMELNKLMNSPLKTPLTVTGNINIPEDYKLAPDTIGLLDRLIDQDPEIAEYKLEKELAKLAWNSSRWARFPKVVFETSYGYIGENNIDTTDDKYSDYTWRLSATMPLFSGFKSIHDKQWWNARTHEVELKINERQQEAHYTFVQLSYELEYLKQQLKVTQADTQLFKEKLAATQEKETLGQATPLDTDWAKVEVTDRIYQEFKVQADIKRTTQLMDLMLNQLNYN